MPAKKTRGGRGKAKPIVNTKKMPQKEKEAIAKELAEKVVDEKSASKKGMGAPKKMTKQLIQKLKLCFSVGMNDEQACFFSGISTSSLYDYQSKNPDFLEEKKVLKESITMQARVNVGRSIKAGNVKDSWMRLGKRDQEFSNKLEVTNK